MIQKPFEYTRFRVFIEGNIKAEQAIRVRALGDGNTKQANIATGKIEAYEAILKELTNVEVDFQNPHTLKEN